MPAPITVAILELMELGKKSAAQWAAELGYESTTLLQTALGLFKKQAMMAKDGETIALVGRAARGMRSAAQAGRVITLTTAVTEATGTGLSIGARVALGVGFLGLLAVMCYIGYTWYQWKHQPKPADETEVVEEPEPEPGTGGNGNFTDRPLRGNRSSGGFAPGGSTSTQPEQPKQVRLIDLPTGVGKDEFVSSAVKVVSGGPVSSLGARQISEQNQRDLEQRHNREYEGFGASWSNTPDLVWNPGAPIPPVVKAEFKQDEDRNVTGWIWVARSRTKSPGGMEGFQCTKLKVTIGRVSGARGSEELNLDAGDGLVRGALYLTDKGKTIKGELNGSPVTLFRTY